MGFLSFAFQTSWIRCINTSIFIDDDDKLYLTTLTLSAKAGFHNGRVNKSKFTNKDKGSKNLHAYM